MLLLGIRTLAGTGGGVAVAVDAVSLQGLELSEIKHAGSYEGKLALPYYFTAADVTKGKKNENGNW